MRYILYHSQKAGRNEKHPSHYSCRCDAFFMETDHLPDINFKTQRYKNRLVETGSNLKINVLCYYLIREEIVIFYNAEL